jgi:glucan phosphoethanolaminetransferase (alkaline phosphatase superfamily)
MPATSAPTLSSPRHALPRLARTYPLALWWGGAFLILHSALRLTLALATWHGAQLDATSLLATLGRGLVFDGVTLALMAPVLLALESLVGARHKPAGRIRLAAVYGLAGVLLYAFGFGVLAEWFFWDEFGVRFNFIAVDYLIYTHEVIGNIRESFPVGTLLSLLAAAVILAVWASRRWLAHAAMPAVSRSTRIGVWVASLMLAWGAGLFWSMDARLGANEYQKELSANGLYSFGYAFTHNSIDYFDFYATRPGATLPATTELPRVVAASAPRNVVIITMESLSSSYTAHGGNTKGLTPNIDRLADNGLFLANLRAAGNRTVRGLEALSLAIPPMP